METKDRLFDLISQRTGYPLTKISGAMEFEQDLNLSHAEVIDFISEIEKNFNVAFRDEEITEIKTVENLEEILMDHLEVSEK